MRAGRRGARLTPALALVLVLAGCGQAAELEAERAAALQEAVLTVSEEAAAGRYDAAQAALVEVREQLEAAVDAGEVSTARYGQVDDALDRTGQEVSAALASQAAARAAERAAAEQAAAEQAAAQQAAAEQAAAQEAAAQEAAARDAAARAAHDEPPRPEKGPKHKGPKDDDD